VNRTPGLLWRVVALLAAALLPAALPGGMPARPDLVLLVVGAAALMHGPTTGALVGLGGGWLVDLVPPGGDPLGASALTYLAAGALAGWARRFATWSWLLPLLAVVAAAVLVQGVRVVAAAAGVGTAHPTDLLWSVLVTTVVALVLLPALLAVERALMGRGWV
jgi:rod shape-determining protein MreD